MYSYIEALEKLVLDLGGKIHISSPVNEIIFKNPVIISNMKLCNSISLCLNISNS